MLCWRVRKQAKLSCTSNFYSSGCVSGAAFVFPRSVISTEETASNPGIRGSDSETHTMPLVMESIIVWSHESWLQLANMQLVHHPDPADTSIFMPFRSAVLLIIGEFACPPYVCFLSDVWLSPSVHRHAPLTVDRRCALTVSLLFCCFLPTRKQKNQCLVKVMLSD